MYILDAHGTARERGEQHGEEFRTQIRELADIRRALLRNYLADVPVDDIERLALWQLEKLHSLPELFDEFCAISEAANVSLCDLIVLNNYTDMRDFVDEGCSAFAIRTQNQTLCGQTWDMHASARPYLLHLRVRNPIETEILTVTGCLGLAGVNAMGVAVLINNLHCHETQMGLIWPAVVRGLLGQTTAHFALEFLKNHMPCSGHNYLICDSLEAINIETTGTRLQITSRNSQPGVTFHTNHYLSDLKNAEIHSRLSATTHRRFEALDRCFNDMPLTQVDPAEVARTVFCDKDICVVPSNLARDPHAGATCGGIFLDLTQKRGELFGGFYAEKDVRSLHWGHTR